MTESPNPNLQFHSPGRSFRDTMLLRCRTDPAFLEALLAEKDAEIATLRSEVERLKSGENQ